MSKFKENFETENIGQPPSRWESWLYPADAAKPEIIQVEDSHNLVLRVIANADLEHSWTDAEQRIILRPEWRKDFISARADIYIQPIPPQRLARTVGGVALFIKSSLWEDTYQPPPVFAQPVIDPSTPNIRNIFIGFLHIAENWYRHMWPPPAWRQSIPPEEVETKVYGWHTLEIKATFARQLFYYFDGSLAHWHPIFLAEAEAMEQWLRDHQKFILLRCFERRRY